MSTIMAAARPDRYGGTRAAVRPEGRYESRPSLAARAAAALRFGAPSLASTAETWWSTVLAEMNSFAAIAALVCPAQISSRTSRSRRVSPSGSPRVAASYGQCRSSAQLVPLWAAVPVTARSGRGRSVLGCQGDERSMAV